MHGDEQTAKPEQMAASKAEVVQSWYCWTCPSSCPKNQASSTSPVLGRRALANATVVLARAHVLREKAVAARRVVEKLQDTDPEFPFCGSSRQGRIGTSFPGKHERNGVCFFLLRGEGPGDYDMEMQFINMHQSYLASFWVGTFAVEPCISFGWHGVWMDLILLPFVFSMSFPCLLAVGMLALFLYLHPYTLLMCFFIFQGQCRCSWCECVFIDIAFVAWLPPDKYDNFKDTPSPFDRNFQGVAAMLYAMDVGEKRWHSCWPPRSYRAVGQQWQLHVMLRCRGWLAGVQGSILYS